MKSLRFPALVLMALIFSGCASLPENSERSEQDPWERYNRAMYQFNDSVDRAVLKPVAKGYRAITPDPVEKGVSNFFSNLSYPLVIVNQLLQGDFLDALSDTGRFLVNTTIGIGGIFDPATHFGLEAHNEDFGQTLGRWGVPSGPYLVLPFLGPSTVRDTGALVADFQYDPMVQLFDEPERYYVWALGIVNMRAQLLDLDPQLQSAYDPYAFIRDAYLQRREYLVHDGNPPRDEDYYDDLYEDFDSFEDIPDEETEEPAEAGSEEGEETSEEVSGEEGI
ncbi:MAG TPA: VacJ family lipoprotein [Gammaproteobacteria bacterium]|nr:VacJ family lipoprotein [Gammaproteobacteria bacterium]